MDEPHPRIRRSAHQLVVHRRKPRRRRRAQMMLAQKPAQQITRAVRSAVVERDQRGPIEHRASRGIGDDRARGVRFGELVDEPRGFGLVRGASCKRRRITGKRRRESGRDLVPDEVALDVRIGVRFVIDPRQRASLGVCVDRRAGKREQGPQQHGP